MKGLSVIGFPMFLLALMLNMNDKQEHSLYAGLVVYFVGAYMTILAPHLVLLSVVLMLLGFVICGAGLVVFAEVEEDEI